MRTRRLVGWLTALALVAPAVAACGGLSDEPASSPRIGAEAVAWREARYAAGRAGVENLVRFFDKHVVVEQRVLGVLFEDRRSYLDGFGLYVSIHGTGTSDPAEPMGVLLSATGMLDQYYDPGQLSWAPVADDWMLRATVGSRGYTHVVMSASVEHWRSYLHAPPDLDRTENLAHRYVALWNGAAGVDAAQVYAKRALVKDSLEGLSVGGLRRIHAAVRTGQWPNLPRMDISRLPEDPGDGSSPSRPPRGEALYFGPAVAGTKAYDEMVLLLEADDGSGCPGVVGAALALDHGRIIGERRYHGVQSLRRCFDSSALAPGWWQGIDIPEPVVHELTGTVTWAEPDRSVAVYNGTAATNDYVRWGLQRFADAGLTLPEVDSVTFVREHSQCPLGRPGYSRYDDSGGAIFLCFPPGEADESEAELVLLHELSHVWMHQNVGPGTEQAFMRSVGVARWDDPGDDWDQRGVEQAANTMMFGLMSEPRTMGTAGCEAFAAEFRQLTGGDPLAPCLP
jgi:hypothetical protein